MSSEENRENTGFKVTDRRLFTEDGELRSEIEEKEVIADEETKASPPPPEPPPDRTEPSPTPNASSSQSKPDEHEEAVGVDFSSFLISLATTALVHLGEIPEAGGSAAVNIEAARQMIDVINMLRQKTSGNLTVEENRLIEDVLYELRMKFLSRSKVGQL